MTGAFLYLLGASARNRVLGAVRRLRSPRYAIAMVVGIAYFWALVLRPDRQAAFATATAGPAAQLVYELLLAGLVASWWIFGSDKAPLQFSPAEVQFLFPAPVSRRQLVEYKLLRMLVVIFVSSMIWTGLLRRSPTGAWWMRALALFVLFATLQLHRIGALFIRSSAIEHGTRGIRRHAAPLLLSAAVIGIVGAAVIGALPELRQAVLTQRFGTALARLMGEPLVAAVLLPIRLLVTPIFSASTSNWARAMGPALLLLTVHVPWVLRTDAAFEEAAAEAAARRAAAITSPGRRPARARTASRPWFHLSPTGAPGGAITWKNMLAFTRGVRFGTVAVLGASIAIVFGATVVVTHDRGAGLDILGTVALAFAGILVVFGPNVVRYDLRIDMLKLELLRAYPLSGAAIVSSEIAASLFILTAQQVGALGIGALILAATGSLQQFPIDSWPVALSVLIALPTFNALRLWIANASAVLFPAWVHLGEDRPTGVEATGQGLVNFIATTLALIVLALVPAIVGGIVAAVTHAEPGNWWLLVAVFAGVVVALGELTALVAWLGRVFERTEPPTSDVSRG